MRERGGRQNAVVTDKKIQDFKQLHLLGADPQKQGLENRAGWDFVSVCVS